jgi:hypothetical protein
MPTKKIKDDLENKNVKKLTKLISDNYSDKVEHDNQVQLIQDLFEEGFTVSDPAGTRKISSLMLQQALWNVVSKLKFLDFQIHGTNVDEMTEKLVTDGVSTVLDEGGLSSTLRNKNGTFWQMALYGDGFIAIGTDDTRDYPVTFSLISVSNIYVDTHAEGVRSGGKGKNATEMLIVYSMSQNEAERLYPDLKKYDCTGKLPRQINMGKELEQTYNQTDQQNQKKDIEIGYYYNSSEKIYLIVAGSTCTILEEKIDKDYPFVREGVPYIPISQFLCMPASKGFYNKGIGQALYRLAIITRRLRNMMVGHLNENVFPITLTNVPQGEAASFFNKLALAEEMRAQGKKGMVAMEYDPTNPNSSRVSTEALSTPNGLVQEWQLVMEDFNREIARLGIYLDAPDRGANVTATQIAAEEEAQSAWIKQIGEYNADESKFLIDTAIDFIKKFVKKSNDTPLNLTTRYTTEGGLKLQIPATLGGLSDELKKNRYFIKLNVRSGSVPSNIMRISELSQQLAITPPGSPAYMQILQSIAKVRDLDFKAEQLTPPVAPTGEEQEPIPTETDNLQAVKGGTMPMPETI